MLFWYRFGSGMIIVSLSLLLHCTPSDSAPQSNPNILQWLQQLPTNSAPFQRTKPTLLLAFDVPSSLRCGVVGMKAMITKVKALNRDVNIFVVVQVDRPAETKIIKRKFPGIEVIPDTGSALRSMFKIEIFPALLIVDTLGNVVYEVTDPSHNFPPDSLLLTLLPPKTIAIDRYRTAVHFVTDEEPIEVAGLLPIDTASVLLVDKAFNAVFRIHSKTGRSTIIWQAHDSLRFHPTFRSYPIHHWDTLSQQTGLPFIQLDLPLGWRNTQAGIYAIAYVPAKTAPQALINLPIILWLSIIDSIAVLDTITLLSTDDPEIEDKTLQLFNGHPVAATISDTGYQIYRYRNSNWESVTPLIPTSDTALPEDLSFLFFVPVFSLSPKNGLLYALDLPHFIGLQASSDFSLWKQHSVIPYTGLFAHYRSLVIQGLEDELGVIEKALLKVAKSNPDIQPTFSDGIKIYSLHDSLYLAVLPFFKIQGLPQYRHTLGLQLLHPQRGLIIDHQFNLHQSSDPIRDVKVAVLASGDLAILTKRKRTGWFIYHIPQTLILTNGNRW